MTKFNYNYSVLFAKSTWLSQNILVFSRSYELHNTPLGMKYL